MIRNSKATDLQFPELQPLIEPTDSKSKRKPRPDLDKTTIATPRLATNRGGKRRESHTLGGWNSVGATSHASRGRLRGRLSDPWCGYSASHCASIAGFETLTRHSIGGASPAANFGVELMSDAAGAAESELDLGEGFVGGGNEAVVAGRGWGGWPDGEARGGAGLVVPAFRPRNPGLVSVPRERRRHLTMVSSILALLLHITPPRFVLYTVCLSDATRFPCGPDPGRKFCVCFGTFMQKGAHPNSRQISPRLVGNGLNFQPYLCNCFVGHVCVFPLSSLYNNNISPLLWPCSNF